MKEYMIKSAKCLVQAVVLFLTGLFVGLVYLYTKAKESVLNNKKSTFAILLVILMSVISIIYQRGHYRSIIDNYSHNAYMDAEHIKQLQLDSIALRTKQFNK